MSEGQEVMERTNSPAFCWKSRNKGSFSSDMLGVQCLIQILNAFSSDTAAYYRWSADQIEKHWPTLTEKAIKQPGFPNFRFAWQQPKTAKTPEINISSCDCGIAGKYLKKDYFETGHDHFYSFCYFSFLDKQNALFVTANCRTNVKKHFTYSWKELFKRVAITSTKYMNRSFSWELEARALLSRGRWWEGVLLEEVLYCSVPNRYPLR
jgi:hypothetical protein